MWNRIHTPFSLSSLISFLSVIAVISLQSDLFHIGSKGEVPSTTNTITKCVEGSGWKWTYGPEQPEIGADVQRTLSGIGIDSEVRASSYGEEDDCGVFISRSIDFEIRLRNEPHQSRDELESLVISILEEFASPRLGNVKIISPDGNKWTLPGYTPTWGNTGDFEIPQATFNRKVYVIVYNPLLDNGQTLIEYMNWNDPAEITQMTIDFFNSASNGEIVYEVAETTIVNSSWPALIDGFAYTEETYFPVLYGQSPPHEPWYVDYNAIVNSPEFDICGKANNNEIDEVWIYNGPWFGFWESTLVGPEAYWYNSPPVPEPFSCNRLIPIMGPNPERWISEATENFGHRTESTMMHVYGSWQQNRTAHNWERFALVKDLSPDYTYSGCGNIHFPPNGTQDYEYDNPSVVDTNCDDFWNYPNLGDPEDTVIPVTCTAWNCKSIDFFAYWYEHFPVYPGCGPDLVANDWWNYFAIPALANDPISACPSYTVSGTIRTESGDPIPGVLVEALDYPSSGITDDNGIYLLEDLIPGTYTFIPNKADYVFSPESITLDLENDVSGQDFIGYEKLQAFFSANPTFGPVPLEVDFSNDSTGDFTSSLWNFGDGSTSTVKNPTHTYNAPGYYSVSLTVNGPSGEDTKVKDQYIYVIDFDKWYALDSGVDNWLWPIQFISEMRGWAGGEGGIILDTSDGGVTWQMNNIDAGTVNDFHFIDNQYGWAVGWGFVRKTEDGGKTWQEQDYGADHNLLGVYLVDRDRGWLVGGEGGWIYRTLNGGQTWTRVKMPGGWVYLQDIVFIDNNRGWAVGWGGTILHSTDGGVSWQRQDADASGILEGVYFINEQKGWVVGHEGVILHTEDGGENWEVQSNGTDASLMGVGFANEMVGWAVGNQGTILITRDGGQSWSAEESGVETVLQRVRVLDVDHVWAAGEGGVILKRGPLGNKEISLWLSMVTR